MSRSMIFGITPPLPSKCYTCHKPRWQWDAAAQKWLCLRCYEGNPMVLERGAGPVGKQCQDCRHLVERLPRQIAIFCKCDLRQQLDSYNQRHWPACARFEAMSEEESEAHP